MQRLIQDTIRKALADELLFGRLTEGGPLTVEMTTKSRPRPAASCWTSSRR